MKSTSADEKSLQTCLDYGRSGFGMFVSASSFRCSAITNKAPASAVAGYFGGPKTFDTSAAGCRCVGRAAGQFDETALAQIFGPDGDDIVFTGEVAQDRQRAADFAAEAREKRNVSVDPKNGIRAFLLVGNEDWPFPVPIVKRSNRWYFDGKAGRQETLVPPHRRQ